MSLFGKKKETVEPACACNGACEASEAATVKKADACCPEAENGICCIKVLGLGCKSCHTMFENTQKAVDGMGLGIEVEYITDMQKIMAYGAMSMPALVINAKVVGMGKVYKADEIAAMLHKFC